LDKDIYWGPLFSRKEEIVGALAGELPVFPQGNWGEAFLGGGFFLLSIWGKVVFHFSQKFSAGGERDIGYGPRGICPTGGFSDFEKKRVWGV